MKSKSRITVLIILALVLVSTIARATSFEKVDALFENARVYFEAFTSADAAYAEATKFKKGEGGFEKGSLTAIFYANQGFHRTIRLSKENLLTLKATYNLALGVAALGQIPKARHLLMLCAEDRFPPALDALRRMDKVLSRLKTSVAYEKGIAGDPPVETIDRNLAEEIYELLVVEGFPSLHLTQSEVALYALKYEDLEELSRMAHEVEKAVRGLGDTCIILPGRSPLLLGMMLQERGLVEASIVRVPFSGLKSVSDDEDLGEARDNAYLSFLANKIPRAQNYVVIDFCDSGNTLRYFLKYMRILNEPGAHVMALGFCESSDCRPDPEIHFFSASRSILKIMITKAILARMHLIPGIAFFPRHWLDESRRQRALTYEAEEDDQKPVVALYRQQMVEYVEARAIVARDLLTLPPTTPARTLAFVRVVAGQVLGNCAIL